MTLVLRLIMIDGFSFDFSIACSEFFRVSWVNCWWLPSEVQQNVTTFNNKNRSCTWAKRIYIWRLLHSCRAALNALPPFTARGCSSKSLFVVVFVFFVVKRAYSNTRRDLTKVEGLGDPINADTISISIYKYTHIYTRMYIQIYTHICTRSIYSFLCQAYSNKRMDSTEVEGWGDLINTDTTSVHMVLTFL